MSDEIRERFEQWRNKCGFGSLPYIPLFEAYDAGHKSRDEEVWKLEAEKVKAFGAGLQEGSKEVQRW